MIWELWIGQISYEVVDNTYLALATLLACIVYRYAGVGYLGLIPGFTSAGAWTHWLATLIVNSHLCRYTSSNFVPVVSHGYTHN